MHIAGVCFRIYTPDTLVDTNMQSWSVKSLLYFVVCFIVWTGEYHTLVVDPFILFLNPCCTQFLVYLACCTHHCQLNWIKIGHKNQLDFLQGGYERKKKRLWGCWICGIYVLHAGECHLQYFFIGKLLPV